MHSIARIKAHPWFVLGREDVKAGRGFRPEYERLTIKSAHLYERGRQIQTALPKGARLTNRMYQQLRQKGGVL
jgi:hypothetical protein